MASRIIVLFSILFLISCGENRQRKVINGSVTSALEHAGQNLVVNGSIEQAAYINVRNLIVNGSAEIGPESSSITGTLKVNGALVGDDLKVQEKATLNGVSTIKNSHFFSDLEINNDAEIAYTVIEGNVYVSKMKFILYDKVTIKGRIEFTGEPGTVVIRGKDIHILQGIAHGEVEGTTTKPAGPAIHF